MYKWSDKLFAPNDRAFPDWPCRIALPVSQVSLPKSAAEPHTAVPSPFNSILEVPDCITCIPSELDEALTDSLRPGLITPIPILPLNITSAAFPAFVYHALVSVVPVLVPNLIVFPRLHIWNAEPPAVVSSSVKRGYLRAPTNTS